MKDEFIVFMKEYGLAILIAFIVIVLIWYFFWFFSVFTPSEFKITKEVCDNKTKKIIPSNITCSYDGEYLEFDYSEFENKDIIKRIVTN